MGNFTNISSDIKTILQAVQQNSSPAFVDVLEYPTDQFTGMPSAIVVPSDTPSDYATVQQNRRTYVYIVTIYNSIEDGGIDNAFQQMRTLIDTVLDAFDKTQARGYTGALSTSADFVQPAPSSWDVVETNFGATLVATITLRCEKDIALY